MILSFFLLPLALCSLAPAPKVLPRAPQNGARPAALAKLHNVIMKARADHDYLLPLRPRMNIDAQHVRPRASTPESSAASVKRTLLGIRQTCSAGYGYCSDSGRCCPDDGSGACCDDGTCTSGAQSCCTGGGACDEGLQCCTNGCAPEDAECCADGDYHCESGFQCCGGGICAPIDGECCADGSVCDSGLLCVIYDGQQTCCEDLSCAEYSSSSSGGSGSSDYSSLTYTYTSFDFSKYSLPSITVPSYTPISPPPVTTPTFSLESLPDAGFTPPPFVALSTVSDLLSVGAPPSSATDYSYYYTTWTWYYWYYYIASSTVVRTVSFTTSTHITTIVPLTYYATASAEADSIFSSARNAVTLPSSVTATDFKAFVATASNSGAEPTPSTTVPSVTISRPSLTSFTSGSGASKPGWVKALGGEMGSLTIVAVIMMVLCELV